MWNKAPSKTEKNKPSSEGISTFWGTHLSILFFLPHGKELHQGNMVRGETVRVLSKESTPENGLGS